MRGLLIKDLKLMQMQKKFFLLVVAVAAGMAVFEEEAVFSSFLTVYLTFIGTLFTLSTINYDEFDNGNAFLFSLPVSRRDYVMEKYGFGVLVAVGSWTLSMVIAVIVGFARNTLSVDVAAVGLMVLPAVLIMLAVMLPVQLRFGAEKGRLVLFGVTGLAVIGGGIARKAEPTWDIHTDSMIRYMASVDTEAAVAAAIAVAIVALFLSCRISIWIIDRKEF